MEVKVYREPENAPFIYDTELLAEYDSLMTELELQAPREHENIKVPTVYTCLNAAMTKQLRAICPSVVEASQYKRTTIPVDVLRVYKLAKDNDMYEGFEIWHDNVKPDPMLIDWRYDNETARTSKSTWSRTYYLLARWGDCALELPELLQLGYERIKQNLLDSASEAQIACNAILASPEVYARKIINGTFSNVYIMF